MTGAIGPTVPAGTPEDATGHIAEAPRRRRTLTARTSAVGMRAHALRLYFVILAIGSAAGVESLRGTESARVALALMLFALSVPTLFFWDRLRANGRLTFEPTSVLVGVFFLWHFSFWVVVFVGMASDYRVQEYFQLAPDVTLAALCACLCGLAAMAAGLHFGGASRPARSKLTFPGASPSSLRALIGFSAFLVLVYFAVRGRQLLGNYDAVFTEEDSLRRLYNLGVLLTLACLAPLLLLESLRAKRILVMIGTIVPVLFITVLMGSRWVVFSSALVVVTALSLRGIKIPPIRTALLLVVLVLGGTYVKEMRAGSSAAHQSILIGRYTNPLIEFLEEVGQAFKAVTGTVEIYEHPSQYRYGSSMLQAAATIVPSASQLVDKEQRPTYEIAERFYQKRFYDEGFTIGFSIVAEFYMNFGIIGVALGCFAIGLIVGAAYGRFLETDRLVYLFVALGLFSFLLFGLRNDFQTWIRYAAWSSVPLIWIGRRIDQRRRLSSAHVPLPLSVTTGR